TLISDVSEEGSPEASARTVANCAAARSSRRMRPPGPDPATVARSIPASRARRRFAGDAMTRPWRAGGADGAAADSAADAGAGAAADSAAGPAVRTDAAAGALA